MYTYRFLVLLLAGFLLTGTTACGGNNEIKQNEYQKDGLLGATSVNPNLPYSPTYHHYANDMKLLRDTIAQIPDVLDSNIFLNGPTVYVTLILPKDTEIEESMRIRNSAQSSLQRVLPRYDVRVSVKKNGMPSRSRS